jgi:hypothetical protein
MANLFKILYHHGGDVVISGHDHIYEHFAPQNPAGKADHLGIRQFIAGTGGANLYEIGTIKPTSEVRDNTAHGVLHPTSYDWEFIAIPGQKFRDRGAAQCSMQKLPSSPTASNCKSFQMSFRFTRLCSVRDNLTEGMLTRIIHSPT